MARYTLGEEVSEGMYVLLKDGTPTNARASKHARFYDAADICDGVFHGGVFRGGVFRGGVFHGGLFYGGVFCDGLFYDGLFYDGVFCGGVFHGGVFYGGVFRGGVFYDGWLSLQIQGSKHFVNIPDGKTIQIGCKNGAPAWWLAKYKTVGAAQGYTDAQIAEYAEYIRLASKMIRANQKAEKAK